MVNNFNKWFKCWIAWEQADGTTGLSVIPWRVLLLGILGDTTGFKWSWVPPWKIEIGR